MLEVFHYFDVKPSLLGTLTNPKKLKEDELKNAVLCVFANKQDLEGAMTATEVANALGLPSLKNRKYQIFKTSAVKGTGLEEGMEWYNYFLRIHIIWITKSEFLHKEH